MMTPDPQNTSSSTPPISPPLTPQPKIPLVDRVTDLEDRLTKLTDLHNRFVEAAGRELGI